ncbi:MAG: 16S rRNA (guanine(966)-N(2))-methyltransferase RsmD [SAR324 cluster bacterium]|nr:16S rRNA (guanine(966)-N(2))-methyltransferase RsmD [SAR324 cluster bacterium]
MISITGGKFRGRKIDVPSGNEVRPTLNKSREAIFNVLQHWIRIRGMTVLDLYAGSGALGLEALSRGAKHIFFVEKSIVNFKVLQKNIKRLELDESQVTSFHGTAVKTLPLLKNDDVACLLLIDPPYQADEYEKILLLISQLETIPKQSVLVVESPCSLQYSTENNLERIKSKVFGKTKLDFLVKC